MKSSNDLPGFRDQFIKDLGALGLEPDDFPAIVGNMNHSVHTCQEVTEALQDALGSKRVDLSVVSMGSYGRIEASAQSDVDYHLLFAETVRPPARQKLADIVVDVIQEYQDEEIDRSQERVFADSTFNYETMNPVGGPKDTNQNLTLRMLTLMESVCLHNPNPYQSEFDAIWDEYTGKIQGEEKDPQLLINEILRYYRTLCVDYKYKIDVRDKAWAIRSLKLRHSRKLLCISVMIDLLDKIDDGVGDIEEIKTSINSPPLVRLARICAAHEYDDAGKLFRSYNRFLRAMGDAKDREELKTLEFEAREDSNLYVQLRKNANVLEAELLQLIRLVDDGGEKIYKYFIF